jgi:hypothetical protein
MSLAEQLDKIRAGGAKRIAPENRAVMLAATQALKDSGVVEQAIKVGDALPAFALTNAEGDTIESAALLARGPAVLTVFRGTW